MRLAVETQDPVNVSLEIRPLRACVLVPEFAELSWQAAFVGALGALTRVWGGTNALVVPYSEELREHELFWELISLFDPDVFVTYVSSRQELSELAPDRFALWRDKFDAEHRGLSSEVLDDELAAQMRDHLALPVVFREFGDMLVTRTAPLHQGGKLVTGVLSGATPLPWPLVDVLDRSPGPHQITEPPVADDPVEALLLAAEFGMLTPATRERIAAFGGSTRRPAQLHRLELLRTIYRMRGSRGMPPNALAETDLSWFAPRRPSPASFAVVVGDHAWDFALAYALRRCRTLAWWLPVQSLSDEAELQHVLACLIELGQRSGLPLSVTTATDDAAADEVITRISEMPTTGPAATRLTWKEALPRRANRLLFRHHVALPQPLMLQGDVMPYLDTPIPDAGASLEQGAPRWITEVVAENWSCARHSLLAPNLLGAAGTVTRTAAEGPAYLSPGLLVHNGVPLQFQVVRPQLRPLSLFQQLQAIARTNGWYASLGDKGRYAIAASELFGGISELCSALQRPEVAPLLAAYLNGEREAPGIALADRRRYLSFAELAKLGAAESVSAFLDAGILRAGLVLKCERCRHAAWFRPGDFDPVFSCPRCSAQHRPDTRARVDLPEPLWRYRLDETVLQFLRHRGDLAALAAAQGFDDSPLPTDIVPELELRTPDGEQREIDFVICEGGDIWIGEAFTSARYQRGEEKEMDRLRRLEEIVSLFEARGAILATSQSELNETTRRRADTVFPGPWPVWRELAGVPLIERPGRLIDDLV